MSVIIENIRIDGIPCQAEVSLYTAERDDGTTYGEFELLHVLDLKGYRAEWLEVKLRNRRTNHDFEKQIYEKMDELSRIWMEDYADYRYHAMIDECLERR